MHELRVVRAVVLGIAILGLAGATACIDPDEEARVAAAAARWSSDSAVYEDRLVSWLRDSMVIDSIARTVNSDSLRTLFRQLVGNDNPVPTFQAIACEQSHISHRYGIRAMEVVVRRAHVEAFGPDRRAVVREVNARMPAMAISVSDDVCGARSPLAPDSVGGTSLNWKRDRPERPRRPKG